MSSLTEHVGSRIRLYRKSKMLTIDQLAALVSKSKSTVSKYEQGTVSVDLDTLFKLAEILGISVFQLIDYVPHGQAKLKDTAKTRRFLNSDNFYLYYFDGRKKQLVRGFAEVKESPLESDGHVILYLGVDSFAHYSRCQFLYSGRMSAYDTMLRFSLANQSNHIEQMEISILDSLSHSELIVGHLSGILTHPFTPVSLKCVLSENRLEENEDLLHVLKLNADDLRFIKRLNMFTTMRTF